MLKFEKWFHPRVHVEIVKKNYETSARVTSYSAKIPSRYFPNTSPENYHYINLLVF
jgi:hypothetical protein